MHYNASQLEAIRHGDGPALVLAGPGSGKTGVIAGRISQLLKKGISPSDILVITFTRAAAGEMRQRFLSENPNGAGVEFGTFHAVFFHILMREYGYTASDLITDQQCRNFLIRQIRRKYPETEDETELAERILSRIRKQKSSLAGGEIPTLQNLPDFPFFFHIYEDYLSHSGKLDFEDMQGKCLKLLRSDKGRREFWQRQYPYILIDEFQDISPLQFEVITCLLSPKKNLFAVGDDDQCIYGFRGSNPKIMLRFKRYFPDAIQYQLDTNYRCGENIIKASSRLIEHNTGRYPKNTFCGSGRKGRMELLHFTDEKKQADFAAEQIRSLLQNGHEPGDIAVLSRTAFESRFVTLRLSSLNIPYRQKEKDVPVSQWVKTDLIAYLTLSLHMENRTLLLRILNRPDRELAREGLESEQTDWNKWKNSLSKEELLKVKRLEQDLKLLRRLPPSAGIHYLRKSVGYDRFLEEYAAEKRIEFTQLEDAADKLEEAARYYHTPEAFLNAQEPKKNILLKQTHRNGYSRDSVFLSTLHGAKGLEFRTVFLIDASEGILPYKKALTKEEIEEERRLFYVGMTRAKENLYICTTSYYHNHLQTPSRFLTEISDAKEKR